MTDTDTAKRVLEAGRLKPASALKITIPVRRFPVEIQRARWTKWPEEMPRSLELFPREGYSVLCAPHSDGVEF